MTPNPQPSVLRESLIACHQSIALTGADKHIRAISKATAEMLEADAQTECTRSHPHENMNQMCELRTVIARMTHEAALTIHKNVGIRAEFRMGGRCEKHLQTKPCAMCVAGIDGPIFAHIHTSDIDKANKEALEKLAHQVAAPQALSAAETEMEVVKRMLNKWESSFPKDQPDCQDCSGSGEAELYVKPAYQQDGHMETGKCPSCNGTGAEQPGTAYAPLQGLASYLRAVSSTTIGESYNTLQKWADDVDAIAARVQAPLPQQAERVPMTLQEIDAWWREDNGLEDCDMCKIQDFTQVVRAVERKHNIKAKP